MPKKTPTQLDREIAEFLSGPDFERAKDEGAGLEAEVEAASRIERSFPHLPNGLTPDAVRVTPEYQTAKADVARAFARLQKFNTAFVKTFAKELREERRVKSRKELQEERRARQARVAGLV